MNTPAPSFQERELACLHRERVDYVLLHPPRAWGMGDVDILVADLEAVDRALTRKGYIFFSATRNGRQYLRFLGGVEPWLHLDVTTVPELPGIAVPPRLVPSLLARAWTDDHGVRRLPREDEAILLALRAGVRNRLSPERARRLLQPGVANLRSRAPDYDFLPHPLGTYLEVLDRLAAEEITEAQSAAALRGLLVATPGPRRPLLPRLLGRLRSLVGPNRAIVFLGPDGAGKTTVTEPFGKLRWPPTRRQFMGPSRWSEIRRPIARLLRALERIRDRYSARHPLGFLARLGWQLTCWVDLLERLNRHRWFWGSGGMVVFDRYAWDMYIRKPTVWNHALFITLFPRPRFVVLCTGDARRIRDRKPELTRAEIEEAYRNYYAILARTGTPYAELSTTELPSAEVVPVALSHVLPVMRGHDVRSRGAGAEEKVQ